MEDTTSFIMEQLKETRTQLNAVNELVNLAANEVISLKKELSALHLKVSILETKAGKCLNCGEIGCTCDCMGYHEFCDCYIKSNTKDIK